MADSLFSERPIQVLQDLLSPLLDRFFLVITSTGSSLFLLALALLVYWLWDKKAGLFLGIVLLSSVLFNGVLKALFQMPRPPPHLHRTVATGNGFPSGHAQQSAAFWSAAALDLGKAWALLAPLLIGLVALSRVYLGVHYVGDVLGGIAFGLAVSLVAFVSSRAQFWQGLGLKARLLAAALLPSALGIPAFLGLGNTQIWGLLLGISVGHVLEGEFVGLGRPQRPAATALRVLSGLPPLAVLYAVSLGLTGFPLLFPLYITTGIAATFLLPWTFKALESRFLGRGAAKEER